jgi:FixJ family two-component response regulator
MSTLASATMTGASKVRIVTMTEDEITLRAREAFIFAHPHTPRVVTRMMRRGRLDFLLKSARQIVRDIEKPVDMLTHESRAAWVIAQFRGTMAALPQEQREIVADLVVMAVRVGVKD